MNTNLCLGHPSGKTREWAHRSLLLIFKVRRRTDCGVSHQTLNEMCENLWLSHRAVGSSCHTPNGMLKGHYKSIQPTENNGARLLLFLFIVHLYAFTKKSWGTLSCNSASSVRQMFDSLFESVTLLSCGNMNLPHINKNRSGFSFVMQCVFLDNSVSF